MANPSHGVFSKLPYELRETIWLEFLPVARDTQLSPAETSAEVDLRVLLASKALYAEISNVLYSKTCLHFDLSPDLSDSLYVWGIVSFRRRPARAVEGSSAFINGRPCASWKLESEPSERRTYFDNFPFHKVAMVEVSLRAPRRSDPDHKHLYRIWRNVMRTIMLFKFANAEIAPVTIQLKKGVDRDWDSYGVRMDEKRKPGYDILVLPFFYALRNLKYVAVVPHSDELRHKMDWKMISWASNITAKRIATDSTPDGDPATERQLWDEWKLWRQVEDDLSWMNAEVVLNWQVYLFFEHGTTDWELDFMKEEVDCDPFKPVIEAPPLTKRKGLS